MTFEERISELENKYNNRPRDIETIYNNDILKICNEFYEYLNKDGVNTREMTYYVLNLTQIYKLENDELGLTFNDKYNKRYMNFLCSGPEETVKYNTIGHINQHSHFYLLNAINHYYGHSNKYDTILDLPIREIALLDILFTVGKSEEILKRNQLGYDKNVLYKYYTESDKDYCDAVLDLFREIVIRIYNYSRYISGPDYKDSTEKDVNELYDNLFDNYLKDKEYADKGLIGRTLEKIKMYREQ